MRLLYLCLITSFFCCSPFLKAKRHKYFIAIKKNEGDVLNSLDKHVPLLPPKDRFYADPFLFKFNGANYIFFEDFDYKYSKKGVIAYVSLDRNGAFSKPQVALELPIHLSFPYIFQENEEIYMIPETYSYQSVSLYKGVEFPNQWKHQRVLIQGDHFADTILFKHNGYYWLFTSIHGDRLQIYYAADLKSQFQPHPINQSLIPGRNAGPIFYINNRPIRPTMDCSVSYGRSMIFKEIVLLTTLDFVERDVAYIEPNWADRLDGTHAYCQNEDYVVYDGRRSLYPHEDIRYSSP